MKAHISFMILMFIAVMLLGCSAGKGSPVVPSDPSGGSLGESQNLLVASGNGNEIPAPNDLELIVEENNSNRQILGAWQVTLDVDSLNATVNPVRNADQHWDGTPYATPVFVTINSYDRATHVADVDVTITNPLQYHKNVYDVRLIIITDEIGHSMRNPDNWTELWDDLGIGLSSNPFKAYNKHLPNRSFHAGTESTENVLVYCPEDNYDITIKIDVSYPGNCEEPYEIKNFQQEPLPSILESTAWIQVDVHDWQNDVNEVKLQCPDITGTPIVLFTDRVDDTWKLNLENTTGAPAGEYGAMIFATSENSGALEMIDRVKITVTDENQKPTVELTNCQTVTGESYEFEWTMADDNTPVEDLIVEIKLDDDPWIEHPESPGATSYLWDPISIGSHTFNVRVTDDGDPALTSDPPASCPFERLTNPPPEVEITNCPPEPLTENFYTFEWTMSDDNTPVEDLIVEINKDESPEWLELDNGALNYEWTGLTEGSHTFEVRVTDDGDPALTSEPPALCEFTQSCTLPDAPENVSATDGTECGKVIVTWTSVVDADYYKIYLNNNLIKDEHPNSPYEHIDPSSGPLSYEVTAVNDCGEGPRGGPDTGYPKVAPEEAPTVSASDGTYDDYVRISWNSVSGADSYKIYRNGQFLDTDTSSPYNDSSSEICQIYSYSVKAINECGEGPMSSSDDGYRGHTPSAPTGVAASDGTYDNYVRISWNSVSGADYYRIYRDGSRIKDNQPSSPYNDTTATPGTHYNYQVSAVNDCDEGPKSDPDVGWRNCPLPAKVTGVSASNGTYDDYVLISWNSVSGADNYKIYRNGGYLNTDTSSPYRDYSANPGTHYDYQVSAVNDCGEGPKSDPDVGWRNCPLPAKVTGVSASDGTYDDYVLVSWDSIPGADNYIIYRNGGHLDTDTSSPYSDYSANPGTHYNYQVSAVNSCGEGPKSNSDEGYASDEPWCLVKLTGWQDILDKWEEYKTELDEFACGIKVGPRSHPEEPPPYGAGSTSNYAAFGPYECNDNPDYFTGSINYITDSPYGSSQEGKTWVMYGPIYQAWKLDYDSGGWYMGYPLNNQVNLSSSRAYQIFEGGYITSSSCGAFPIRGAIRTFWLDNGGMAGTSFGPACSGEEDIGGGTVRQEFQDGCICYNPSHTPPEWQCSCGGGGNGFGFPVGYPDASGYYNAQGWMAYYSGYGYHLGDDWNGNGGGNTDCGDTVYAVADGVVTSAYDHYGGWGKIIFIRHDDVNGTGTITSMYAHLDTIDVNLNDLISAGESIGTIGDAHGMYYCHLHFEIRIGDSTTAGPGYVPSPVSQGPQGQIDPTAFINAHYDP
ncbi:peptidoglycan DD-metalloendopeptidase family protein [bacterium]|nr:peptidoglycan DD-metalloendopeptidase family protein [bacterium]